MATSAIEGFITRTARLLRPSTGDSISNLFNLQHGSDQGALASLNEKIARDGDPEKDTESPLSKRTGSGSSQNAARKDNIDRRRYTRTLPRELKD